MENKFKEAYWRLGALMQEEASIFSFFYILSLNLNFSKGRLPDSDLIFFLTHQEIGRLIRDRNGALVAKSAHDLERLYR